MTEDAPAPRSHSQPGNGRAAAVPGPSMIAAVVLGIIAIGLGVWALELRSDWAASRKETSRLEGEIAQLRENAGSMSYWLLHQRGRLPRLASHTCRSPDRVSSPSRTCLNRGRA